MVWRLRTGRDILAANIPCEERVVPTSDASARKMSLCNTWLWNQQGLHHWERNGYGRSRHNALNGLAQFSPGLKCWQAPVSLVKKGVKSPVTWITLVVQPWWFPRTPPHPKRYTASSSHSSTEVAWLDSCCTYLLKGPQTPHQKNTLEGINSRLEEAEYRISDLKDKVAENTIGTEKRKKKIV